MRTRVIRRTAAWWRARPICAGSRGARRRLGTASAMRRRGSACVTRETECLTGVRLFLWSGVGGKVHCCHKKGAIANGDWHVALSARGGSKIEEGGGGGVTHVLYALAARLLVCGR